MVSELQRGDSPLIAPETLIYFRDLYDHVFQVMDTVETLREMVAGMLDIYLSSISNRLNEVMKVLTIIATIFIPLTFIVGLYGMNFRYMPELSSRWGYPGVWAVMVVMAGGDAVLLPEEEVDLSRWRPACPRRRDPEYPRPQWVRPQWLNLNGEWEFAEDPQLSGEEKGWASGQTFDRRILVPFAPESALSGIGNTDFMTGVWYRRSFRLPEAWKGRRCLLHFGAVDYDAKVWLNGQPVGEHRGGYTPFSFDITPYLWESGENELVVRAIDRTRSPLQPTGKQSQQFQSYGCVYTRTTGIWQTVWLEPVPETHLARARMFPDLDNGRLVLQVWTGGARRGLPVAGRGDGRTAIRWPPRRG